MPYGFGICSYDFIDVQECWNFQSTFLGICIDHARTRPCNVLYRNGGTSNNCTLNSSNIAQPSSTEPLVSRPATAHHCSIGLVFHWFHISHVWISDIYEEGKVVYDKICH